MFEHNTFLSEADIRRLENIDARRQFKKVLDLAAQTCLKASYVGRRERQPSTAEAQIVATLGTRGLKAALDIVTEPYNQISFKDMTPDEPLRYPELFHDPTDLEVASQIEDFGAGLLAEAYLCLGEDAVEQIENFKQADTLEQQIGVLAWLDMRLCRIASINNPNLENEGHNTAYHPIRLSPKVVGEYPNIAIAPTCLGVSVIAASFLHQVGAPVLHAGVMQTRRQEHMLETTDLFHKLDHYVQEIYGLQLPPKALLSLCEKSLDLLQKIYQPEAYHAAVLVQLKNGEWVQVDSNFDATSVFFGDDSEKISSIHQSLIDLEPVAPGLETTFRSRASTYANACDLMVQTGDESLLPMADAAAAILTEEHAESVPQRIYELVLPFFKTQRKDDITVAWEYLASMANPDYMQGLEDTFYTMFERYVLWSEPLDKMLEHCRRDGNYLARRIADIRTLPFLMLANSALKHGRDIKTHQVLEVGLPAFRIGAAVLNDFMTVCDNDLSASFRVSHWPSQVPITEVMANPSQLSPAQKRLVVRNAVHSRTKLPYLSLSVIIGEFIRENEEELYESR